MKKEILLWTRKDFNSRFPKVSRHTKYLSNADEGFSIRQGDFSRTFFFMEDECCGMAIRYLRGSKIDDPVVSSVLYGCARPGSWKMFDTSVVGKRIKSNRDWEFHPADKKGVKAFAQHQNMVGQVVVWAPNWVPPLKIFLSSPMS